MPTEENPVVTYEFYVHGHIIIIVNDLQVLR